MIDVEEQPKDYPVWDQKKFSKKMEIEKKIKRLLNELEMEIDFPVKHIEISHWGDGNGEVDEIYVKMDYEENENISTKQK